MGFYGDFTGINGTYTLVMTNIAIENGPVEIVDLPIDSMVIFNSYVTNYQRVINGRSPGSNRWRYVSTI